MTRDDHAADKASASTGSTNASKQKRKKDPIAHETVDFKGGFVPDADEGAAIERCRAPDDHLPYDADEIEGACFACRYCSSNSKQQKTYEEEDVMDAYTTMKQIWEDNWGKLMSEKEVIDAVYEYYQREIRGVYNGMPRWTKKSIYAHITKHICDDDVCSDDMIALMRAQIESLRGCCWNKDPMDGNVTPSIRELTLLEKYVKSYTELLKIRKIRRTG